MANYIQVELDTTPPASTRIEIELDNQYTTTQDVVAHLFTGDVDETGYQMKIYGDVDLLFDAQVQDTFEASDWLTFADTKNIRLSDTDGIKRINFVVRDKVFNTSTEVFDTIDLNTSQPSVSLTNQDRDIISTQDGKRTVTFNFTVTNMDFVEYIVKVVDSPGASVSSGAEILTTNGSSNTSGTGTFLMNETILISVDGADLKAASSLDEMKYIKCFARDEAGNWSS